MNKYSVNQAMQAVRAWGHTPLAELPLLTEEAKLLAWWAFSRRAAPSPEERQEVLEYARALWFAGEDQAVPEGAQGTRRVRALVPSTVREGKLYLGPADMSDSWQMGEVDFLRGGEGFGKIGALTSQERAYVLGPALCATLSFLKGKYDAEEPLISFKSWMGHLHHPSFGRPEGWGQGLTGLFQGPVVYEKELRAQVKAGMLEDATFAL